MPVLAARVRAFDWLRGLAVLVMVECHALVLLRPDLHATRAMARLNWVNGLVAPAFIFAAGFSLALVRVRAAPAGARRARLWRTLRRILEVLAVGTLLNVVWFPVTAKPGWLLRVDILQCIALSLLLALPLLAGLAHRPRLLAPLALAVAAAVFFAAPFAEAVRGPWEDLFRMGGARSTVFPLAPWTGYVFLGVAVGTVAGAGQRRDVERWLVGLAAGGAVITALTPVWLRIYPPHSYWVTDPANNAQRWMVVCVLLLGLLALEARLREGMRRSVGVRFVELFGTSSLAAYFFHQMLLYYEVRGVSISSVYGARCSWGGWAALTAAILLLTGALAWGTDRIYRFLDGWTVSRVGSARIAVGRAR